MDFLGTKFQMQMCQMCRPFEKKCVFRTKAKFQKLLDF